MAEKQNDNTDPPLFELLDFYATWCEPCKLLDSILEVLGRQYGKRLKIKKIDIDRDPDRKDSFNISSVPVLVLLQDGQPVWRMNGFLTAPDLKRILDPYLENPASTD